MFGLGQEGVDAPDGLVQCEQWYSLSTNLLWWRESWKRKQRCWFTGQSIFLSSPRVTNSGLRPKRWEKWGDSEGWEWAEVFCTCLTGRRPKGLGWFRMLPPQIHQDKQQKRDRWMDGWKFFQNVIEKYLLGTTKKSYLIEFGPFLVEGHVLGRIQTACRYKLSLLLLAFLGYEACKFA